MELTREQVIAAFVAWVETLDAPDLADRYNETQPSFSKWITYDEETQVYLERG